MRTMTTGSNALLAIVVVVALTALVAAAPTVPRPTSDAAPAGPAVPVGPWHLALARTASGPQFTTLSDGGALTAPVGSGSSSLSDSVGGYGGSLGARSYVITIRTSYAIPSTHVELVTDPIAQWADPLAIPDGPDALPGLGYWAWSVVASGVNDTANWVATPSDGLLTRTIAWENATFTVAGAAAPTVDVTFNRSSAGSGSVTGAGFSVNAAVIGPRGGINDPALTALTSDLHPAMVRAGLSSLGTITGWNNTTSSATLDTGALDWFLGFAHNLSAEAYVSLPAGTWGDGNSLPSTFPVNTSVPVSFYGTTGWFASPTAYAALVTQIASHVASSGESVSYWNIGNEVPVSNTSLLDAYVGLFNAAAQAIHAVLPGARVGSDVMTDLSVLPTFATEARGVGFLAFHYYPAQSVCVENRTLCPAGTNGEDLTDAQIWNSSTGFGHLRAVAGGVGQAEWHNLTGAWLPVIDAETNLNTAGGNAATSASGTDPRQQTLFGAAWTVSMLIDATAANVSRFNYYALESPATTPATVTGPYGGWGFGLIDLGAQGNVTQFAPWWALQMWGANIPSGSAPLPVTVSDPALSRALVVPNGTGDAVILTNRADTPVTFHVSDLGAGAVPVRVAVLDRTSYVTVFNASAPRLSVVRTGVTSTSEPAGDSATFTVQGYGVAVVLFGAVPPQVPVTSPPLLSTSMFFEATILGGAALVAATIVVVYHPRRRRAAGQDGSSAPGPKGRETEDEL